MNTTMDNKASPNSPPCDMDSQPIIPLSDLLLSGEEDINARADDGFGRTALMLACANRSADEAISLIKHGADLEIRDEGDGDSWTALMYACHFGLANVVDVMIARGADLNKRDTWHRTALMYALGRDSSIAFSLIKNNACLDGRDQSGETAMMKACTGLLDVLKLMHSKGVDLNVTDTYGDTGLMIACRCGGDKNKKCDVAKFLINQKVDLNAKNKQKKTALMFASFDGLGEVVDLLLENNVDLEVKDEDGRTALMYACEQEHESIAISLINHNACFEIRDNNDKTVFMYACVAGLDKVVDLIIEKGAKLDLNDKDDYAIFDWQLCHEPDLVSIVPGTIKAGMCPGGIVKHDGEYTSPLIKAFEGKNYETVKMILDKLYFFKEDYAKLKRLCHGQTDIESDIADRIMTQPLKLGEWTFLAVSKLISLTGGPCGRKSRLERLPLPCAIKRKLSFQ